MARIRGLGKRRRLKVRVNEDDIKTVLQMLPILFVLLFGLYFVGWIAPVTFGGNVSGWP